MNNMLSHWLIFLAVGLGCFSASPSAQAGLTGEYFPSNNFTGAKTTRMDATVDFDWGSGSPGVGVLGTDHFSVRWSGQVEPRYTETYTFYVTADDGATLWVNDRLIVSRLFAAATPEMTGQIVLKGGQRVNLRLEYIEKTGNANVRLEWASASQPREVIPASQLYPTTMPAERGGILCEHWANLPGSQITALATSTNYPNRPDGREILLRFESLQTNWAANIGTRLTGYLMPQTNGLYTFAVAASDTAELWLSTDANAANKELVARVPSATGFRDWSAYPSQVSTARALAGWQKYYVELLHKAGTNDNHFSVAWKPPGAAEFTVIGADHLIPSGLNDSLPAQTNIFNRLTASHPRLFATEERFEWLRREIAANPAGQPAQWYGSLYRSASDLFATPPVTYTKDNRGTILTQSRNAQTRMYLLGLAWKMTGDTNFAERAWTELDAAGHFPDWNPSHFLDTAEMTHAFGVAYDWFHEYWTPARRTFILTNITTKGLSPGLSAFSNNVGWTRSTANNWNMVCNGGLTLGALALGADAETIAEQVVSKTVASQAPVMQRWTADNGAWFEGPGYWDYASDYNFRMLAGLQSALGSDFGLSATEGLNNAGLFAMLLTSANRRNFNFADASMGASGGPQMIWWARRFNVPAYAYHERTNNIADVLGLLWWDERGSDAASEGIGTDLLFLGPTGATPFKAQHVGVLRSSWADPNETFLAFKGGEMGAAHGNLDAGTFVLEALGARWAWDLGADDYALPGYFNSNPSAPTNRWQYYRMRAEGQNTLVINPSSKPDMTLGAVAPVVLFQSKPGVRALSVVDLTPVMTNVTRVWRGFQLFGPQRKQALIQDEIEGATNADVWWFMHYQKDNIQAAVSADGTTVTLTQGNKRLWGKILSGGGAFQIMDARPLPTSPDPPGQNPNTSYGKLAIHLSGITNTTLAVWFVPLAPGQNPPIVSPPITPLAEWHIPEDDSPLALDGYVTTPQNTSVDVDLATLASDTGTSTSNLVFSVGNPTNGTVTLLADGHTARFTPATNFYGTGLFLYSVSDAALHTTTAGVVVTVLPATWYWDGASDSGLQPTNGIWSSATAMWSSTPSGSSPLLVWPPLGNDAAFIGAGGAYTVTLVGTQQVHDLFTTNGTWTLNGGALQHANGPMTIVANADTIINAPIIADTMLIKGGLATLTLGATNSYNDATVVNAGTLTLTADNVLPVATDLTIGNTNGTAAHLHLSGCNQTVASLRFQSLSAATNTVRIASGNTLGVSNAAAGIAFGVGNYGDTIGALAATTRVCFVGGGDLDVNAPRGAFSIEPCGTNSGVALLDLSGLSSFRANVSNFTAAVLGGKPNNVSAPFTLLLASNNLITATNIVFGASGYGSGASTVYLGASNVLRADTIVFMGGRYTGTMKFQVGSVSNLVIRGVAGGDSRANLYIGDQVGLSGLGYSGGSSTCNGTLDCGGATLDVRLNQLTIGSGASVASSKYGTGMGTFLFGSHNSTVDVHNVYLGYAKLNSSVATNNYVPNHTGTLTMNGGTLMVNSNLFLGYSADNDLANTQKVTGVFTLNGGTATVAGNVFLGWATNTVGAATGILNLSNGTLDVHADIVSFGAVSTGIVNLVGATLNLNSNNLGSALQPVHLVADRGTLQNVAEFNGGAALLKSSSGTLVLAGINTYSGTSLISNGTLRLGGQLTASAVTVASSATLTGAGALGNGLTVSPGAHLQFALGSHSDRIDVIGHLALAGTVHITDAGGLTNTSYTLFTYTGNLTCQSLSIGAVPTADYVYQISTNTPGQIKLLVAFRDSVGDGIPDAWRREHFGGDGTTTNALSAADADPDGDGQSNLHEYLAGTVPTQAASVLKASFDASSSQLTWTSVPGKTYQVEYCDDLSAGLWQPLPGAQVTAGPGQTNLSFTDNTAASCSNRFYRVRVLPP